MDGLRKSLIQEFSNIYVFHLRGNQRTSGELSRKEGGKIFGSGSRAPIAITLFVKNPNAIESGQIYFYDIGDYLTQKEKLEKIAAFKSIDGIRHINGWQPITPDNHGDWINQRDDSFANFYILGDKQDKSAKVIFSTYSMGIKTNRDEWVFNFSKKKLLDSVGNMLVFYNSEVDRLSGNTDIEKNSLLDRDKSRIKWTNARYPLELFQRVITVSLESMKIVNSFEYDITI
jgi:predicted helicase